MPARGFGRTNANGFPTALKVVDVSKGDKKKAL